MANPQPDLFIKISTELYEQMCRIRIPGEIRQVLDAIIRKTYGYGKKEDRIALIQFAHLTGQKRPNIVRSIQKLLQMNLIIKRDNDMYSLQKNYDLWKPLSKQIKPKKKKKRVIRRDNLPLSDEIHTIDTYKDNKHIVPAKELTPVQRIVITYKVLKGFNQNDKDWDRIQFRRNLKPAKQLLDLFQGNVDKCKRCMQYGKNHYMAKNLDWSLETLVRYGLEWKKDNQTSF